MSPDLSVGRWAVMPGYAGPITASKYDLLHITKVTAKLVKGLHNGGRHERQHAKESVIATFDSEEAAMRLIDQIAGIRGERDRRVQAANESALLAIEKAAGKS